MTDFGRFGMEDEDDEDAETQFMIEQSLLEANKKKETPTTPDNRSSDSKSDDVCKIFTAVKQGNEKLLEDLCVRHRDMFLQMDSRGWIPLHEAASQSNQNILELTYGASGSDSAEFRTPQGQTPLFLAVGRGLIENVSFLLKQSAQADSQDQEQDAPLFVGADVFSQARDEASILYEASAAGNPAVIHLLLEYGADANIPNHTGHMPIHRAAHRGNLQVLKLLLPVTDIRDVHDSGISPLHSAAAVGNTECIKTLLDVGYDPNYMLHPWIRRSYDDERKSALFFAVSNNDLASAKLLLESGAMPNQDPIKCLQVALRLGNYELINLLLRHGANVNYYSRINTTHFPSALQYALKDEVVLRMLCNYGYDVGRCFDCPYGNGSHTPEDYEGWTNTVIKDTMFCEVITVSWLKHLSGHVIRTLLDYVDHVTLCSKLKATLMEQKEWPDICSLQGDVNSITPLRREKRRKIQFMHLFPSFLLLSSPENARCLKHLCRLRIRRCLGRLRLRSPVFMSFVPLPERLKNYLRYREYDLWDRPGNSPG
ncbi:dynein axonemal heavy chain 12-like isoform X3 [Cololabis saira]|uniref:dynein axonemal heavy chain 12-like isoform X3 n=1 Tax=Cololabis saira TaxID=129043 RepID=UPI002AD2B905|nr:dynein axonemal heavy chain 12-like isoform X3 [Cololabis saira]